MADEGAEEQQPGKSKGSGGKKKLIIMVVLALLLVGISVGGTLFVLTMLGPQPVDEAPAEDLPPEDVPPPPAIYYPIKPPLVVNFSVKGRQRFLQAEITLMTREDDVIRAIELHQPMLRNALVLLIGGQTYSEIQTAEGKELLRQQCLQEIQALLQKEIGKPGVEQVLFTNFVLQ